MRYFVLSLVLLITGVVVTQLERETQDFTPVVRVRTHDGLFLTFVQQGFARQADCSAAVAAFSDVLTTSCPMCVIESSGCPSTLEGIDRALYKRERLPIYTVSADTFRVAIVGPPHQVELECREMAAQMARQGIKTAACNLPELVPAAVR